MTSISAGQGQEQLDDSLSSADRRRHDLTVDLYLRHGHFWRAIKCMRHSIIVAATTEIPKVESLWGPRLPVPAPGTMPFGDDGSSKHPPFSRERFMEIGTAFKFSWDWALAAVSSEFIAEEHRDGTFSSHNWLLFLVQCVYHDPPPDRLLEFADHFEQLRGERAGSPLYHTMYLDWDLVRFADHVAHDILSSLATRLGVAGVEIDLEKELEVARAVARDNVSFFRKVAGRTAIQVGITTTQREVVAAFRQIHSTRPRRTTNKPGRPPRDSLRSLQAAVWVDDFGLTEIEVGERLGCAIQDHEWTYARRSPAARGYIYTGREIRDGVKLNSL